MPSANGIGVFFQRLWNIEATAGGVVGGIAQLGVTMESPVSRTGFPVELLSLQESSLGNLAADSIRAVASSLAPLNDGNPCDFSVVASGVIRDNLYPGTTGFITFADIYNVLPLGISPDTSQPVPGYPLMSLYVTAGDLRNICEAALTVAPVIGSDFYLNFSGLQIYYDPMYAYQRQSRADRIVFQGDHRAVLDFLRSQSAPRG